MDLTIYFEILPFATAFQAYSGWSELWSPIPRVATLEVAYRGVPFGQEKVPGAFLAR